MSTCTHHWTVTSECPSCLRAELNEAQTTLAQWSVRREAERSAERKNFEVVEKMRQDAALRLEECARQHTEAVAAFHDATRLRSEIQQARIKAEAERDEALTNLASARSSLRDYMESSACWEKEAGELRGALRAILLEARTGVLSIARIEAVLARIGSGNER